MQQKQHQYIHYVQTGPKIALAPPATAAVATTTGTSTATWPPAASIVAPIGSLGSSFQPTSPQADHATDEWCERCCKEKGEAGMPCSCCYAKPLLSAKLLKATAG
ncbi:uncharacterized protein LOC116805798 [Drosophila grimshawi]|uniref:uncharacterized protein LOC116805798 n=1 Tax=Drosophila grimshawi TaxID=7222 RepID=UPI000C86F9F0|nr:uncharacterized protein LOC116805798 [Drosophila grimshawi]